MKTEIKEKPILFNGEMVRALLDGSKTMTRRVIKNPDYFGCLTGDCPHMDQKLCDEAMAKESPYGQKGDQLWVRETFAIECNADLQDVYTEPDNPLGPVRNVADGFAECFECPRYKASEPDTILGDEEDGMKWKPSIHMPRWASRIQLEITDIRVERVQKISEYDAMQEGCGIFSWEHKITNKDTQTKEPNKRKFIKLWNSINEKRGYSWKSNPWVWVVEFKSIKEALNG